MTRKQRQHRLRLWQEKDPEGFAWHLYQSACKGENLQFVMDAGEALKSRKPRECWPLPLQVQAAYLELCEKHRGKVTKKMIRETIDPERKIADKDFSRAFNKARLSDLPRGKPGPKPKP